MKKNVRKPILMHVGHSTKNDTPAAISKGADVDLFIIYYFKFQNSMFKFS